MGYTVNSVEIGADARRVFNAFNDPKNWVAMMGYKAVDILGHDTLPDGKESIRFQITNDDDDDGEIVEEKWVSHRILDREAMLARGVREAPMFPFRWWILDIAFVALGDNRMKMVWTQDFSMDPKTGHTDEEIEGYINKGSLDEMAKLRELFESGKF